MASRWFELLVVVSIIMIIAAIAIPNLLRARISANEASAAGSVRTTNTAEISFFSTYPQQGYSNTMAALGPGAATGCPATGPIVTAACFIDYNLASATTVNLSKSGYYFNIGSTSGAAPYVQYTVGAAAGTWNQTGVRGFCSNEDGVIHQNSSWNGAPQTINTTCAGWPQL